MAKQSKQIKAAIDRLADVIDGHLLAATDPVGFLDEARSEILELRNKLKKFENQLNKG